MRHITVTAAQENPSPCLETKCITKPTPVLKANGLSILIYRSIMHRWKGFLIYVSHAGGPEARSERLAIPVDWIRCSTALLCTALDSSLHGLISSAVRTDVHGEVAPPSFVCHGPQEKECTLIWDECLKCAVNDIELSDRSVLVLTVS